MLGIYLLGNIWLKIEQNNEISRTERRSPVVGKVIGQFDTCFSQKDSSRATLFEGRRVRDQRKYMGLFSTLHRTLLKITSMDDDCYISGDWRAQEYHFKASYFGLQNYLNCLLKRYNESVAACGALCTVNSKSPPEIWRRLPWWIH